ncbi:MAG: XisI protein [Alkalinema sp. CACIAM 70d]|nr:MAG: XisI protein [Alkalinema sp. CACIAM 70d]
MERLEQYRDIITALLAEYAGGEVVQADSEIQTIYDRDRDHYQLVSLGWQGNRRFYSVLMNLDIKNGKVWIQRNETDRLTAQALVERGVRKEDIVLGLQPEYARADTGYSIA